MGNEYKYVVMYDELRKRGGEYTFGPQFREFNFEAEAIEFAEAKNGIVYIRMYSFKQ